MAGRRRMQPVKTHGLQQQPRTAGPEHLRAMDVVQMGVTVVAQQRDGAPYARRRTPPSGIYSVASSYGSRHGAVHPRPRSRDTEPR